MENEDFMVYEPVPSVTNETFNEENEDDLEEDDEICTGSRFFSLLHSSVLSFNGFTLDSILTVNYFLYLAKLFVSGGDNSWDPSARTLKSRLINVSVDELQDLYSDYLRTQTPLDVVDGVEECIAPALPFPSPEMLRKKDSVMADYIGMCSKLGVDPNRPNAEVITKLLLFIESTKIWNPYSIKYSLFIIPKENEAQFYLPRSIYCQVLRRGLKHFIEANRPGCTLSYQLQRHIEVLGSAAVSHAKMSGTLREPRSRNPMLLYAISRCLTKIWLSLLDYPL
jgi:hypothetical protein